MANQTHSCVHPGTRVTQGVRFHACVLEPQWRFVTECGKRSPIYKLGLLRSARMGN